MKILVIRFSSAGDIILTSPFVRALRRRYPDAEVHFAVKEEFASLLEHSPHVDRLITLPRGAGFATLLRMKSALIAELGGEYDIVFDLHDSLRSRHLRFGMGRAVAVVRKPTLDKWLLVHRKIDRMQPVVPIPLRYLETGRPFSIEDDGEGLELHIGGTLAPIAPAAGRPTIGLAPGARHFTKRWPAERYRELAGALVARLDARIVIFGSDDDRSAGAEIIRGLPDAVNLAGRATLLEAAAACDVCDVVVTNDSAMTHVAAARRRPVVTIFGSTAQQFGFGPFRTPSAVVENVGLHCRPCTTIGRASCPEGHFRCMLEIGSEEVAAAVVAARQNARSPRR
ncbi:MAG TPA: glycosyltransferase family 9 protein [Candidatus Kapabacteria bacterium]|nr:glycosyltransferase family 9 protein [Candidatus Kapabacteria bacterium]